MSPVSVRRARMFALAFLLTATRVQAESPAPPPPVYLVDRGGGVPTSQFGIYIHQGEWMVYTFYEYTKTSAFEYKPSELGFSGNEDFLGSLVEHESLVFISHGLTDRVELEFEAALNNSATFEKDPTDPSAVPDQVHESGLGDVEGQIRWRWTDETERRPELFSFFETAFPLQKDRVLIGTHDWEFNLGLGVIKGHSWGTLTGRVAVAYDGEDGTIDLGEYAVEYLKKVSRTWRLLAAVEVESDEVSLIGEGQARLSPHVLLKLNCGFGLSQKAPDLAPEAGVLFSW